MIKTNVETNTNDSWKGTWETCCNNTKIKTFFPTYESESPNSPRYDKICLPSTFVSYVQSCYKSVLYTKHWEKNFGKKKEDCYRHSFYYKDGKMPIIKQYE